MARQINRLKARTVASLTKPGMHADGAGLYLRISTGGRRWVFLYHYGGKRREMGLGGAATVTLAEARVAAREARATLDSGDDPLGTKTERRVPTFGDLADEHIKTMSPRWRNAKHRQQWRNTLLTYAEPIAGKPVDKIDTNDVLAVLMPIWQAKPETASRVRGRIETILDVGKVRGYRDGQNPAQWRGHLALTLPSRAHQEALRPDGLKTVDVSGHLHSSASQLGTNHAPVRYQRDGIPVYHFLLLWFRTTMVGRRKCSIGSNDLEGFASNQICRERSDPNKPVSVC